MLMSPHPRRLKWYRNTHLLSRSVASEKVIERDIRNPSSSISGSVSKSQNMQSQITNIHVNVSIMLATGYQYRISQYNQMFVRLDFMIFCPTAARAWLTEIFTIRQTEAGFTADLELSSTNPPDGCEGYRDVVLFSVPYPLDNPIFIERI